MPHRDFVPTRILPARPNLDQLRKLAKDLLKSYRAGEPAAVAEIEHFERPPDPATFSLADAQRVLARSYGFSSWARLKSHVNGLTVESFCAAVQAGDVAKVRELAASRPELVNVQRGGEFGETLPIHFAVLNRDAPMTRVLMELGANARQGIWPHRDATAAYVIAKERDYEDIVKIIEQGEAQRRQQLSSPGATISSKTDEIKQAILTRQDDEAIRILERDLSLVGACDVEGMTPLHFTARALNPKLVAWLLDHNAPIDARDLSGRTPLDCAAFFAGWSANDKFFPFLENVHVPTSQLDETVHLLRSGGAELTPRAAVATGDKDAVQQMHRQNRLTNEVHFYRGGLLAIAVRVNRIDMVSLLLDLGLDADERAIPLEDGDESWGFPLWFAAVCGRCEIAERLLDHGADVNAIVHACGDSMSVASATGNEPMISLLSQRGSRITVEGVAGGKDREMARAILEGRVPAQSLNVDDPTPTDLAEQMLWAAGGSDPEIVRICLPHMKRKPDDPWWNYVLIHATLPDSFRQILDHGVDPNVKGSGGYTILHHLATAYVRDEDRLPRARLLLNASASLAIRDPILKSTPLGWACRWGHLDLVQLYLDHGADPMEPDAEPWSTPLAWATKGGHQAIIDLLQSRGASRVSK